MSNIAAIYLCFSGLQLAVALLPTSRPQRGGTALGLVMSLVYAAIGISFARNAA